MLKITSDADDIVLEGFISDTLKDAGLNTDAIKDDMANAQGAKGKLKVAADTSASVKSIGDRFISSNSVSNNSLVARARNSVLQFPIYITQSIRVNEAQIVSNFFARAYTTLVQTVLSQNPIIKENEANNLAFLKNFHTNLKESSDVFVNEFYEPIDEIDGMLKDSVFYSAQLTENMSVSFSAIPSIDQNLLLENARLMNEPLTGFSYLKEADGTNKYDDNKPSPGNPTRKIDMTVGYSKVSETDLAILALEELNRERKAAGEDPYPSKYADQYEDKMAQKDKEQKDAEQEIHDKIAQIKTEIARASMNGDKWKGRYIKQGTQFMRLNTTIAKSSAVAPVDVPTLLRDADIKRINNLTPYTMKASFRIKHDDGSVTDVSYIIGVKSVLHPVHIKDLSGDLEELVTGKSHALQKVRYKTGEISTLDYLFNIKGLKGDALKRTKKNTKWVASLKRLADYSQQNKSMLRKPMKAAAGLTNGGTVPIPNGTLVLTNSDTLALKSSTGIDLSSAGPAKSLAKSLFLIAVCIVDESAGTLKVLFPDADTDWDVQSLASIDSELAKTDNSALMKELNKAVNR